jgi:pantoate--beta-alanine ligase
MRIVRSVKSMQQLAKKWQGQRGKVSFVPTMGYLHAGHLSLVRRARQLVGKSGHAVVSIFVNPTQFGPAEDFSRYPRDVARDTRLCREAGVDVLFVPQEGEMYPRSGAEAASTWVIEEKLSRGMEGASRPTHFRGVTTIVAKLFNIVQPTFAIFGSKDYQQAAVIQRMVRDLNFPVRIVVAPTYRESDGLAMSSRNKYLTGELRTQAVILWRSLQKAQEMIRENNDRDLPAALIKGKLMKSIEQEPAARVDYIAFFEPDTLRPVNRVTRGTHMALAVFIGKTRLIDNARL